MELGYFANYFSQYNNLAAIIVGFSLISLTQVVVMGYDAPRSVKSIYWMTTACTFAPGLHCMLITMMILVYGPGMAIRGPLGSMKKAIDGMVIEQREVFKSFVLTLFLFGIAVTITFWLEAYDLDAWVCTVVMCMGLISCYHFCLRIYNRFNFDEEFKDTWDRQNLRYAEGNINDETELPEDWRDEKPGVSKGSGSSSNIADSGSSDTLSQRSIGTSKTFKIKGDGGKKEKKSILRNLFKRDSSLSNNAPEIAVVLEAEPQKFGYLSFRGAAKDPWERYYCVLSKKHLWFYRDKKHMDTDPGHPVKTRPVMLEDYIPTVNVQNKGKLIVELVGRDEMKGLNSVLLRFDTLEELNEWSTVLSTAAGVRGIEVDDNDDDDDDDNRTVRSVASRAAPVVV